MARNMYVPLSEMAELEHDKIVWRATLPEYVPSESIMINVTKLGKLAWLGGMDTLRIDSHIGDTTQVIPEVRSVNEQGVASASSKAAVGKANTYESDIASSVKDDLPYEYQWSSAKVSFNIAEIDEKVGEKNKLRDPKAWSKQLDKALKAGIIDNAWESLVGGAPPTSKMEAPLLLGGVASVNFIAGDQGAELIANTAMFYSFYNLFGSHFVQKQFGRMIPYETRITDSKMSAVAGIAPDRYFLAKALTMQGKLVKPA